MKRFLRKRKNSTSMRMRKKKHAPERLSRCSGVWLERPEQYRGRWQLLFGNENPIHAEIGCGKGGFLLGMAQAHPDVNFVGVEVCIDVLVITAERIAASGLSNVRLLLSDARLLAEQFAPEELSRLYLNFSDPWPKSKHAKRRLTSPSFLALYKQLLPEEGEIHFKTDNQKLFEYSLCTFSQNGFQLKNVTLNLHSSGFSGNVMTEYEQLFSEQGQPIYRLEAFL